MRRTVAKTRTRTRARGFLSCTLALALAVSGCARSTSPPAPARGASMSLASREFEHVIVIVLENENAAVVDSIPAMASLARRGAALTNYFAVAHPSYPNYLALISGNTFIDRDARARHDPEAYHALDFGDAQLLIDAPTIVDRLQAKRLSWNAFAEDYPDSSAAPVTCDFQRESGLYVRKHVPFLSFRGFHEHPGWCAHVRNLKWFRKDSLASYTFITPNLIHDGHDAPLDSAVKWLDAFLQPILSDSAVMRNTLIVVTFDESANPLSQMVRGSHPNHIYTALLGGMVRPGMISDLPYSHYSLLRTIELNFGLAPSLVPASIGPISGVWRRTR